MSTNEESVIAEWYRGQTILVTGGTGFMGKVLVEKLLRSCAQLSAVYLLMRPKKGRDPNQRLKELLKCPIFDTLRHDDPSSLGKLHPIAGDLLGGDDSLDISNDDLQLLRDTVTVVFHMAASVRFDMPLRAALQLNVAGTKRVLETAATFTKLKAFVHVSTSYCHCDQTVLEERIYKAPYKPKDLLALLNWMDDDLLQKITPTLLGEAPNTYAFSKCLGEELVYEYSSSIPVVIVRPSIVTAIWREPLPGWVEGLHGPTGVLLGAGKGVIRTMHCNADLCADVVPADVTINALLAIAWTRATRGKEEGEELPVFHVTADKENPITWRGALEMGRKHLLANPFSVCLWYPGGGPHASVILHAVASFFLHTLPAYLLDLIMLITGNKTFMVRTQRRITSGLRVLQYYTVRDWRFQNERVTRLLSGLGERDRELFYGGTGTAVDHDQYLLNYILGVRRYCARESDETLPQARKTLKRLYYLDVVMKVLLALLTIWIVYKLALKPLYVTL